MIMKENEVPVLFFLLSNVTQIDKVLFIFKGVQRMCPKVLN